MTFKKKISLLIGIMLLLTVIGATIVNINSRDRKQSVNNGQEQNQEALQVVTTFYPMYIIAQNIFDQVEDVTVTNLTDFNVGCAHDYQLTTDNMKLLSSADIIIVNGGGLEGFLEDVIDNFPKLQVVDSSENITMIAYDEMAHNNNWELRDENDQDHEDHRHDEENEEEHNHDGHDHGEFNAHIWLDPQIYVKQIQNVRDGILNYLKENNIIDGLKAGTSDKLSTRIEENADDYINTVLEIDNRLNELLLLSVNNSINETVNDTASSSDIDYAYEEEGSLYAPSKGVAIFHDSFMYLAKRLGLKVEYAIEVDSESALRAKDITNIINLIHEGKIQYLFAENLYGELVTSRIQGETDVEIFLMDPIITGDGSKDSYIKAMESNIQLLEKVLQ